VSSGGKQYIKKIGLPVTLHGGNRFLDLRELKPLEETFKLVPLVSTPRDAHPKQKDRRLQPSRVELFRKQRTKYLQWKRWADITKMAALSPRLRGPVTSLMLPVQASNKPEDLHLGTDDTNETYYPFESSIRGDKSLDAKTHLGIIYDD